MTASPNRPVGVGVLGANSFVATRAVLPAIDTCAGTRLVAAASRSAPVPDPWAAMAVADYEDVLAHPDVEAVYLPLPNGLHHDWTERAAEAGAHVLCEKPLAPDATTAAAMRDACDRAGVLLAEAWMTPFHPRWRRMIDDACTGSVGEVMHQDHRFTFRITGADNNYRWQPDQGGGSLLDVGIYTVGTAVAVYGLDGVQIDRVDVVRAPTGVDAAFAAHLRWPGGRTAFVRCSFLDDEAQTMRIVGSDGELRAERSAFTGGEDDEQIVHVTGDGMKYTQRVPSADPYLRMIDAFAHAVRGVHPWPHPSDDAVRLLALLDRLRDAANG